MNIIGIDLVSILVCCPHDSRYLDGLDTDRIGGCEIPAREGNGGDFFAGRDNGDVELLVGANGIDTARQRMVENALVEEHQGIRRLVLGCGRDVSVHGQVGQERFDLWFGGEEHCARAHAVKTDEPCDPIYIGSLGVNGVVVETEHRSDIIGEFGLWISCRNRPIIPQWWCPEMVDSRHRAKLPENPANIALSGQNGKLISG
jgi:hypothetical protein